MKKQTRKKEAYFGSVRFFRHLVLTVILLLIGIPSGASVVLLAVNSTLDTECQKSSLKLVEQMNQIQSLKEELKHAGREGKVGGGELKDQPWNQLLVNDSNTLPYDFQVNLRETEDGIWVDERIADSLESMIRDAAGEGIKIKTGIGYLDLEGHQAVFNARIGDLTATGLSYKDAYYKTRMEMGLTSKSEYHTGLCVGLLGSGCNTVYDVKPNMKFVRWLEENCYKYGFILRYPEGKEEITGIEYEPYCYRYVGQEAAVEIMGKKITLEEYLGRE